MKIFDVDPRLVSVGFLINEVAMEQTLLRVPRLSLDIFFYPWWEVSRHQGTACLEVVEGEWPPLGRVAANTLNKQTRTADKGWSFSWGFGRGTNKFSPYKITMLRTNTQSLGLKYYSGNTFYHLMEYLLSCSFVSKMEVYGVQNCNCASCFVWVWILVSQWWRHVGCSCLIIGY